MEKDGNMYVLKGSIQHYDWGGQDFIPSLIGVSNDDKRPFAEYWLGTHPKSPAIMLDKEKQVPLPDRTILPYLLKVLDVKNMLSIQVHPSKKAAEIEFARENKKGIPLDAPHRNYRDDNHKPEMMIALGEFWLLHGFKPEENLRRILDRVPELRGFLTDLQKNGYEGMYRRVMSMDGEEVKVFLGPLLDRIVPEYRKGKLEKSDEDYWAARAALTFNNQNEIDKGIFSIYFFNLVCLRKGDAIFQAAGIPHAYLEGQCVEIMSNSDNVLRGGLTTKHIDVDELMKHIDFSPVNPTLIHGHQEGDELVYCPPVTDFRLGVFHVESDKTIDLDPAGPEIVLVISGTVELTSAGDAIVLVKGQSAVIFPGKTVKMRAVITAEVYHAKQG